MGLRDQLTNLSPRERRLLTIFGAVFALMIFLGAPVYIFMELSAAREDNQDTRQLLRRLDRAQELLTKRRAEQAAVESLYNKPAPPLASFIESAAKANGLDVPESTDRPDIPHEEGYTERVTVVKMKQINLKPLVKMLERIERSGHPVAITLLDIKARASGPDLYDVTLGVSAYDKTRPSTPEGGASGKGAPKKKKGAPASKGGKPL